VDFIILPKEQFRKIGTVLSLDTGDEGALHGCGLGVFLAGINRLPF
jgi:hypothetical protein